MDAHRFLGNVVRLTPGAWAIGLAVSTAPLLGQTVEGHSDRLNRLIELRDSIEAVTDSANLAMARAGALDSARVGGLRLYFSERHRAVVEQGGADAGRFLESALGSETAILDRVVIAVGFTNDVVAAPERSDKTTLTTYVSRATPETVEGALLVSLSGWLNRQVDSLFRQWSGLAVPVADTPIDWEELWVEFATATSPLAAACERGDEPDCLVALGLVPVENPVLDWYDAEGRRQLVRRLPNYLRDGEELSVCLDREWDQICIDILERQETITPPLSHTVRRGLMQYVLARAPGGFGRLLAADSVEHVSDVLSAVAQQELTTLIRDWRERIASSRPDGVSVRWPTAATTVLWVGMLLSVRLLASHRRAARTGRPDVA